jgi:ketosteroid isomerase-like protein
MNHEQNIALIRKLYDAFAKGDIRTIVDNVTEDVEWISEGPSAVPWYGKKRGPQQVQEFFGALAATQENMKLTMEDFIAQDDGVATFGRYQAKVKATGRDFDTPVAHLFRIRNGKVSRFLNFGDTAQVLAAYSGASAVTTGR